MILGFLKIIFHAIYSYLLPLSISVYIFNIWPEINIEQSRIMVAVNLIFFIRVENCFAPYR